MCLCPQQCPVCPSGHDASGSRVVAAEAGWTRPWVTFGEGRGGWGCRAVPTMVGTWGFPFAGFSGWGGGGEVSEAPPPPSPSDVPRGARPTPPSRTRTSKRPRPAVYFLTSSRNASGRRSEPLRRIWKQGLRTAEEFTEPVSECVEMWPSKCCPEGSTERVPARARFRDALIRTHVKKMGRPFAKILTVVI